MSMLNLPSEIIWEILVSNIEIANALCRVNKYLSAQVSKVIDSDHYWTLKLKPLLDTSSYPTKQPKDWKSIYTKHKLCIHGVCCVPYTSANIQLIISSLTSFTGGYDTMYSVYNRAMKLCMARNEHGVSQSSIREREDWLSMIEVLLIEERKVKHITYYQKLLYWASGMGSIAIVKILSTDVLYNHNTKRTWPRTDQAHRCDQLIVNAAKHGHVDMVEWFLEGGQINPPFMTYKSCGFLALKWACQRNHINIVSTLLDHMKIVDTYDRLCLSDIEEASEVYTILNYIFNKAAQSGYFEIVKLMISEQVCCKYIVDPFSENDYAIRGAERNGHVNVVSYLLKYRSRWMFMR